MTLAAPMTRPDYPIARSPDHPLLPGIYIHLPYCRVRCSYCTFVVSTDGSSAAAYQDALLREIALLAPEAKAAAFDSVYLGGGTPSLTPAPDLARLLARLRRAFDVVPGAEVTLESNPEDVSPAAARDWAAAGVTRVSVGVQSFDDRELSAVGRRHDAAAARRALETLAGADLSISGDLILGLPEQTPESFRASLGELTRSGAGHVSIYLLETDKSKATEEDRRLHPERYLSDDAQADLWLEMGQTLAHAGFSHYEISNWARPGQQARHNVKYWKRAPTLGLGVSAHELWDGRRRANVSALTRYVEELAAGRRPVAIDAAVSREEAARERLVLGLRLFEGVPAKEVEDFIRAGGDSTLAEDYASWRSGRLLEEDSGRLRFTERGFLVSNEILCRFV
jgi:oxygen-independent coproporphyrinogen III oxidase